jgi:excisionase family DNA binding protein
MPDPVGWLAFTSEELNSAQLRAQETIGSDSEASTETRSAPRPTALLTAEVAAAALSVDPQWLLRQAREGRIPHVRLGKLVRFDPADIAEHGARPAHPSATAVSATAAVLGRRTRSAR